MIGVMCRGLCSVGLVAAAVAVAGCAKAGESAGGGKDEPIRVALVTSSTGPYAEYGAQQRAGVQFAAEQANARGGIDGRKVEVYSADDRGTPQGAVAAAQRLARKNDAKFIIGTIATPVTLAVMQQLKALDAVQFGTQSQGDALTGESCVQRFFRTNANDAMAIGGVSKWLEGRQEKRWDSIAADYAYGRDSTASFGKALPGKGGRLDTSLFAELGTTDFGSNIARLNGGDGLFIVESGADANNFYKQALQFGLFKKYKVAISNAGGINTSTLKAVPKGLTGQWGATLWTSTVDTPETRAFVDAYEKANQQPPADFAGNGYVGMQTLFAGVRKAGSVEPGKVASALEGLNIDTLHGKVTMRAEDHQLLVPVYVGKVDETEGRPELKVSTATGASATTPTPNAKCRL